MRGFERLFWTVALVLAAGVPGGAGAAGVPEAAFPGKRWARKTPAEVGLDPAKLKEFSRFVGGRGCVVRH